MHRRNQKNPSVGPAAGPPPSEEAESPATRPSRNKVIIDLKENDPLLLKLIQNLRAKWSRMLNKDFLAETIVDTLQNYEARPVVFVQTGLYNAQIFVTRTQAIAFIKNML